MVPRSEYPRPQFMRKEWLCLNGEWQFEMDPGDSGLERGLLNKELAQTITVPFCMESPLSGIGYVDFMNAVWYRRDVDIPATWANQSILLHFQACDYDATVWVNGAEVGRHRGGFTPFSCDITKHAVPGERATIVVRARDYNDSKPKGKQSSRYENFGCFYTRTTGIWQTVWMEPVPYCALKRPRITPDVANSLFRVEQPLTAGKPGCQVRYTLTDNKGVVNSAVVQVSGDFAPQAYLPVPSERRVLWEPGQPHLYGLTIELLDASGHVVDSAESYCGLRSVAIDGKKVLINGRSVFQRLVLDQGYYPDGILTAPTEADLERDILLSMEVGFNGARLHQKVFEERFLYHADRLGYLVWGEFPDWGIDREHPVPTYITQWLEELERDYSHPSIVGWCGLNETWQHIGDNISGLHDLTRGMFLAAKAMDTTRPVLDTSGYSHYEPESDIYDSHNYQQDPALFAADHAGLAEGKPYINRRNKETNNIPYRGQPYFCSEFGGTWWNPAAKPGDPSWGYGDRPQTLEEFYTRFEGLCSCLLRDPNMFGYCYTQLTDVFQEQNGLFLFDRQPKFDSSRLRMVQQQPAAIEQE